MGTKMKGIRADTFHFCYGCLDGSVLLRKAVEHGGSADSSFFEAFLCDAAGSFIVPFDGAVKHDPSAYSRGQAWGFGVL